MVHELSVGYDVTYKPLSPRPEDPVVCYRDGKLLLSDADGRIRWPAAREVGGALRYLFSVGETRYFAGEAEAFGDYRYEPPAVCRTLPPREAAFAGVTAAHLCGWYADNRFCGRCGRPMRHSETERAMVCACGNTVYPKICPAVIVGVLSRGRICLTKYNRPDARWALVAGYAEAGETLEDTVRREVLEETGLRVRAPRYYRSQPWGLSGSLLAGFFCEVDGDDTVRVDNVELKEGRWFSPEEIDFPDDGFSLTRAMIEAFRTGRVGGTPEE